MGDKTMTEDDVVARLESGMTIGIGGWGSRRKPMSLVRAIVRSDLDDLTVVSYGGPDVGLLIAAGKVARVVYGFVSLDSIPLEPHFRRARQAAEVAVTEYDEDMLQRGLYAAAMRLPFMPTRSGLGSDVMTVNPELRTIDSPYDDDVVVAVPPLHLDAALVHLNRADRHGNAQYLGPDLYFDDLYCMAADQTFVSCEEVVETRALTADAHPATLRIHRWMTDGIVEAPNGAHFTSCAPDYARDEAFQRAYATAAGDPASWDTFVDRFLTGSEADYQAAVQTWRRDDSDDRTSA